MSGILGGTSAPGLMRRVGVVAILGLTATTLGLASAGSAHATPNAQFVAGAGPAIQVDTTPAGDPANGATFFTKLSADGHLVSFTTSSTNLVAGDANGADDVVVKNMTTGAIQLVSAASDGRQANSGSFNVDMTPDGRDVLFASYATNLVPGVTDGSLHLFLKDMLTGTVESADVDPTGAVTTLGAQNGSLSANGRYIAFVDADSGYAEIYVRDRVLGTTRLVTQRLDGAATYNASIGRVRITNDGRFVTFDASENYANSNLNFVPPSSPYYSLGDGSGVDGQTMLYQRDMQSLAYSVLNVDSSGAAVPFTPDMWALTPDARFVVFESFAGGYLTFWRRDMVANTLVSASFDSLQNPIIGTYNTLALAISDDGNRILFDDPTTFGRDLVRDISSQTTYDVSVEMTNGRPFSQSVGLSGDGSQVVLTQNGPSDRGPYSGDPRIFERSLPPSDTTPPTVTVTGVTDGGTYASNSAPSPGCSTTDSGSGVAINATVAVTHTGTAYTATCSGAVDNAGNAAGPVSVHYTVNNPAGYTTVNVANSSGAGLAGVPVTFRPVSGTSTSVTTGTDGSASTVLTPGTYTVTATYANGSTSKQLTVTANGPNSVSFATLAVTVNVVDPVAADIASTTVAQAGNSGTFGSPVAVNSSGVATFEVLPGTSSFTARVAGGYQTQSLNVTAGGANTVTFTTTSVTVNIADPVAADLAVATVAHAGNSGSFGPQVAVDSSGNVTFQALPGTSTFTARVAGGYQTKTMTVVAGNTNTIGFATVGVTITVVDGQGNLLTNATVSHAGNTGIFGPRVAVNSTTAQVTFQALPGTSTFTAWNAAGTKYKSATLTVTGSTTATITVS